MFRVSYRILGGVEGGVTPKFGVDVEGVYSTQKLGWSGACSTTIFFFNRCSEIDSEAF